jgi:hypothetical protein
MRKSCSMITVMSSCATAEGSDGSRDGPIYMSVVLKRHSWCRLGHSGATRTERVFRPGSL